MGRDKWVVIAWLWIAHRLLCWIGYDLIRIKCRVVDREGVLVNLGFVQYEEGDFGVYSAGLLAMGKIGPLQKETG